MYKQIELLVNGKTVYLVNTELPIKLMVGSDNVYQTSNSANVKTPANRLKNLYKNTLNKNNIIPESYYSVIEGKDYYYEVENSSPKKYQKAKLIKKEIQKSSSYHPMGGNYNTTVTFYTMELSNHTRIRLRDMYLFSPKDASLYT